MQKFNFIGPLKIHHVPLLCLSKHVNCSFEIVPDKISRADLLRYVVILLLLLLSLYYLRAITMHNGDGSREFRVKRIGARKYTSQYPFPSLSRNTFGKYTLLFRQFPFLMKSSRLVMPVLPELTPGHVDNIIERDKLCWTVQTASSFFGSTGLVFSDSYV